MVSWAARVFWTVLLNPSYGGGGDTPGGQFHGEQFPFVQVLVQVFTVVFTVKVDLTPGTMVTGFSVLRGLRGAGSRQAIA